MKKFFLSMSRFLVILDKAITCLVEITILTFICFVLIRVILLTSSVTLESHMHISIWVAFIGAVGIFYSLAKDNTEIMWFCPQCRSLAISQTETSSGCDTNNSDVEHYFVVLNCPDCGYYETLHKKRMWPK